MYFAKHAIVVCTVLAVTTACTQYNFIEPAKKFGAATGEASGAIGHYYLSLNEYERNLYLQDAIISGTEIVAQNANELTPLLYPVFSPESIKARMDAVRLIGIFGDRLVSLAGSDAPQRFQSNISILGENLQTLDMRFSTLAGSEHSTASSAANFVGPISSLLGIIGKMYLESQRQEALRSAVEDGAPIVFELLDLIEQDMETMIAPLRMTGDQQILALFVQEYNENHTNWSRQQKEIATGRIADAVSRYNSTITFRPEAILQSMRTTLAALVKYAQTGQTLESTSELIAYLNQYENDVRSLSTAIVQLRSN